MKIGIDLGGSHIGIGLVQDNGQILEKQEIEIFSKEQIEQQIESTIVEKIDLLRKKHGITIDNIETIGIASPGTVLHGIILKAENLELENYPIVEILKKHFDVPIFLKNDAKCAALCELEYGSLKPYENSVFLSIGTGIGGAVIWNHELLVPTKYPGFEVGHMTIEKGGRDCKCGKKGCFERYASIVALKNEIISKYQLQQLLTGKQLLDFIKEHEKESKMQQILEQYIEDLSIGLANLINIFEPDAICIGGSFIYYEDIILEKLKEKLKSNQLLFNDSMPNIMLATMKNDAGIIGASRIEE